MDEGDTFLHFMATLFPYVAIDASGLPFMVTALSTCAWLEEWNMTIPISLSLSLRFLAIKCSIGSGCGVTTR